MTSLDTSNRPKGMGNSEIHPRRPETRIKQVIRRACLEAKATNVKAGQRLERKTAAENPPVILLAEDDREMRVLLAQALRTAGYEVVECPDGWNLLEHLGSFALSDSRIHEEADLVISDIRMPGVTGLEILEGLQQTDGFPPIILITAFGDEMTHIKAEKFGVAAMFDKPFEIDDLLVKAAQIVPPQLPSKKQNRKGGDIM